MPCSRCGFAGSHFTLQDDEVLISHVPETEDGRVLDVEFVLEGLEHLLRGLFRVDELRALPE